MLSRIDLRGAATPVADLLPRPRLVERGPVDEVRAIISAVRAEGDNALRRFTAEFDGVDLTSISVPPEAITEATNRVSPEIRAALDVAVGNVQAYHQQQLPTDSRLERDGVVVEGLHRAVDRAGCYVPGGRAAYPSTVVMTAVPARVAGVSEVALTIPPGPDGSIPDVTLAAAAATGVSEVYSVGGAQAIAAMAYGTESIPAVDVIVGPGNMFVAVAKQQVAGVVGVPSSFAGPSEVVVVADHTADPTFVAVDVILQAEHGPDGLAWLVTWSDEVADTVTAEVSRLVAHAPRADDIRATLESSGHAVVCDSPKQAIDVVNAIAPEHLELQVADPDCLLGSVRNAGAVFCGTWTPASLGDYLAGPSHVLPTNGTARFASALTVSDFMKDIHVVRASQDGLTELAPHLIALAEAEGLAAHADSVRLRLTGDS